jgi:hypothetical protein
MLSEHCYSRQFKAQHSVAAHYKANTSHYILIKSLMRMDFNYLGNLITNYARCICEIKYVTAMEKSALNKQTLFSCTLDLNFKEKSSKMLHLEHSFVWC